LGTFSSSTIVAENEGQAEFVVDDGEGEALPGRETALQLGVLKLGVPVYMLQSKEAIMSDYKEVFYGMGKLEDYQIKLHVAVAQPIRSTPLSLCDKVKKKVKELVMDIIHNGPAPWVVQWWWYQNRIMKFGFVWTCVEPM